MDSITLIVIAVIVVVASILITLTIKQPKKVKEWLLYAVIEAERSLGSGTGPVKLRAVYDMFITKFPKLSIFVSFNTFSTWVDAALLYMDKLLTDNMYVKAIIEKQQ